MKHENTYVYVYIVPNTWSITSTLSENYSILTLVNEADIKMKRNITWGLAKQYKDAGGSMEPNGSHISPPTSEFISKTQALYQLQPIKCTQAGMLFNMQVTTEDSIFPQRLQNDMKIPGTDNPRETPAYLTILTSKYFKKSEKQHQQCAINITYVQACDKNNTK